jgi:hypothetical protein
MIGAVLGAALMLALSAGAQAGTLVVGPDFHDNSGLRYDNGATGTFEVPQFDDLGGTRTLTKVTLTVRINSYGGKHEFDNESFLGDTITLGIGAQVRVKGPDPVLGSRLIVNPDAVETLTGFATADTDGLPPDFVGTDALSITGVYATDIRVGSRTDPWDIAPYIGTGNVTFEFDGGTSTSGTRLTDAGSDRITTGTNHFDFTTLVEYEYTPEPATLSMLALGGLALLRRRKRLA